MRAPRTLCLTGLGVLMTTHVPDHAFLYASRVVLMSEGRILSIDTPAKALTEPMLLKAYGVPVSVVEICAPSGIKPGIKMVVPNQL